MSESSLVAHPHALSHVGAAPREASWTCGHASDGVAGMESLELGGVRVVLEVRPQYLLVTECGAFDTVAKVNRYLTVLEQTARRANLQSVIVDARLGALDERPEDVQAALRAALFSGRVFEQVALVLAGDLAAAELTMAALAQGARARAFTTVKAAHQWLLGRASGTSKTLPAIAIAETERPTPRTGVRSPTAGSEERLLPEPSARGATPRRSDGTSSGVVARTPAHDPPDAANKRRDGGR